MTELFVRCACGTAGMNITHDEDTGEVFFAIWHYGKNNMSIAHKLRWIWRIVCGNPYPDEIVIHRGWLPLMTDHLKAIQGQNGISMQAWSQT